MRHMLLCCTLGLLLYLEIGHPCIGFNIDFFYHCAMFDHVFAQFNYKC